MVETQKRVSPVFVLHLLFDVGQVLAINVPLKVLGQLLRGSLQVSLVVLKDCRLVVLLQVVGKGVSVHQCPPTFAQGVQGFLQELNLITQHSIKGKLKKKFR